MFYRRLPPLLEFGRERSGIDLSQVKLTHHSLKSEGKRDLLYSSENPPKLSGVAEAGSGSIQEKEKALLAEIIARVNDLFQGDLTDDDQLIYVNNVIKGKLLESNGLVLQASNNTKAQFENSPDLMPELLNALIDSDAAHSTMSRQALNSAALCEGLLAVLLGPGQLYEALRARASNASTI
jgi:type I restriction enzyme R subunit